MPSEPSLAQVPRRSQHVLGGVLLGTPMSECQPPSSWFCSTGSYSKLQNSLCSKTELKYWIPWLHFEGDPQMEETAFPEKSILMGAPGAPSRWQCNSAQKRHTRDNTALQPSCYFRCQTDTISSSGLNRCASVNLVTLSDDMPPPVKCLALSRSVLFAFASTSGKHLQFHLSSKLVRKFNT